MLNDNEKFILLNLARRALEEQFVAEKLPTVPGFPEISDASENLCSHRGAFVSLHKNGELRGCIGHVESDQELYRTIRECALSAAFEDPRFPPVIQEELSELKLEISVLSPLVRVYSVEEIEVGRHGIYMVQGFQHGLLLPQVAVEYGWDRMEFLEQTCRKSGLPKYVWDSPASEFYVFEAEIFSE